MLAVTFDVSINVSDRMMLEEAKAQVAVALKSLHHYDPYDAVELRGYFPLADDDGNTTIVEAIKVRYTKSTVDRLNGGGLDAGTVLAMADASWVHPFFACQ